MEKLFSYLSSVHHRLFGSKRLLPHEELCFRAWWDSLSDHAKKILDAQFSALQFVQRQAAGAKICFFSEKGDASPLFEQAAPDLHVATVFLQASNGQKMPAKIYLHRGRFFSLEFPKRPERYMELHGMRGLPLQVAEVKTHVVL